MYISTPAYLQRATENLQSQRMSGQLENPEYAGQPDDADDSQRRAAVVFAHDGDEKGEDGYEVDLYVRKFSVECIFFS